MGAFPMNSSVEAELPDDPGWSNNYFNYFTEIEEHFQRARGTGLFLLSPLDWALIENWKNAGVPLAAVCKGVDDAFDKWRNRKSKRRSINSLAYCAQAVAEAARRIPSNATLPPAANVPFTIDEIRNHLAKAAAALRQRPEAPLHAVASSLDVLCAGDARCVEDLEDLERKLTALEEKIVAILRATRTDEELFAIREALDRELKPYRGKMTADQLSMLERRYLDTALLEFAKLPRLSLFYIR